MGTVQRMYINGEWVDAESGGTFEDYNPYTGDVHAVVAAGGRADATRAIEAAAAAFPAWAKTAPNERRALFLKAAEIMERRRPEISKQLIEETGSTFGLSMFQIQEAVKLLLDAAAQTYNVTGEILPSDIPGNFVMAVRQPAGVVVGITPWNVPLILGMRALAAPLAYGNTLVIKPSEQAPITAGLIFAEVLAEAGFPPGVLNVVTHAPAQAEEVGDELIAHPKVRRINFTGSTAIGRIIAEKAGRHLKRVLLELGGNAPLLVLRDADLDYAVQKTAFGALLHQGQICMASSRIIVEQPVAEEFAARLARQVESMKAGDPHDPEVAIGPLVNARAVERMQGLVDDAVAHGAQLLTGGRANGSVYQPTVLHQVTPKMRLYSEETFGPLVPLIVVADDAEALRVANDTVYGLSAGIITRDFNKGLELAEQLETGKVHINDQSIYDEVHVPFGGMKDSGWGRFGGKAALEEFTELRTITVSRPPRG